MKLASRHMPKYIPRKSNPWVTTFAILTIVAICFFSTEFLFVLLAIIILTIVISWHEKPKLDKYFEEMRKSRENLSICDFSKEFDCKEIDTWVIRAVYEQVQDYLPYDKPIAIQGSDDLKKDLLLDDDDIGLDLVEEISQRTGRSLDNYESNPYYGKVNTVRDLVLFFNLQNKINTA